MILCFLMGISVYILFACQYNVRETGFIDLGKNPYNLFVYINKHTEEDEAAELRETASSVLKDSGIAVEFIDTDRQKNHPALKHLKAWKINSVPAAVLVSPDGQSLEIPVATDKQSLTQTLEPALGRITSSPLRDKIIEQVIKTYGVVLLVEGPDAESNAKARKAVGDALESVKRQMKWMPKSIQHPPVLVVLKQESISREEILLWSLGLDPGEINTPHAAVLYGRARWIGPMMKGEQISKNNLERILYIIGEDCECGIDTDWIQGTRLPVIWDSRAQSRVVQTLGFDVENPMIKMEMSRILSKGSSSYPGIPPEERRQDELIITKTTGLNPFLIVIALGILIIASGLTIYLRSVQKKA